MGLRLFKFIIFYDTCRIPISWEGLGEGDEDPKPKAPRYLDQTETPHPKQSQAPSCPKYNPNSQILGFAFSSNRRNESLLVQFLGFAFLSNRSNGCMIQFLGFCWFDPLAWDEILSLEMAVNLLYLSAFSTVFSLVGLQWWLFLLVDGIKSDGLIDGGEINSRNARRAMELVLGSNVTVALLVNFVFNVFGLVVLGLKVESLPFFVNVVD